MMRYLIMRMNFWITDNFLGLFWIFLKNLIEEIKGFCPQIKTKLAFWLVSHCKTDNHRLEYAKELQKYMPIDIYGKCGPLNCTAGNQGFANLAPAYKFYLAFENSNCFEYITG